MNEEARDPHLVSVILPVFNSAEALPAQLAALAQQTYTGLWELILVDNGSSDGSRHTAVSWGPRLPQLRVIDAPEKQNSYYARNVGSAAANGDLLIFCDADDVVTSHWLTELVTAARNCDVIGGALDHQSLNQRASSGEGMPIDGLPRLLDFLPYAFTANLAVWRAVFESLGGYNQTYISGGDAEFCWRAQLTSYSLCFAPKAVVKYRLPVSLRATVRKFYRYAKAHPRLYAQFRHDGVKPRALGEVFRQWRRMLLRVPKLLWGNDYWRIQWAITISVLAGRAVGSLQNRVLFL